MELEKVILEQLLAVRKYLVVTYRAGQPCMYQLLWGADIANNREYFADGQDFEGNALTYAFFLLPATVR